MTLLNIHDDTRVRKAAPNCEPLSVHSPSLASETRRIAALLENRIAASVAGMNSETITITPEMAEYILQNHNAGNRAITPSRAQKYANEMKAGKFILTAQGISFDRTGNLNNGQHRLTAIVLSGLPIKLYVTFGEDRKAFAVVDTAGARTGADVLSMADFSNSSALAVAAKTLEAIEGGITSKRKFGLSNTSMLEFVQAHPDLSIAVTESQRLVKKFKCSAGCAAAIYLIMMKSKRPESLSAFINHLIDGSGLEKNSPLLKLRDGLQSKTIGSTVGDSYSRNIVISSTIIMAWNKWIRGRTGGITWGHETPFPVVE